MKDSGKITNFSQRLPRERYVQRILLENRKTPNNRI